MKTFSSAALVAIAALTLAAPAQAAKGDGGNEVTLHIEAEAAIPPDRATLTIALTGSGETEAAALSDIHAKQLALATELGGAGVAFDAIKPGEAIKSEAADEAMTDAETPCAMIPAPASPKKAATPKRADCPAPPPKYSYNAATIVTVADLSQLAKIQAIQSANGQSNYGYWNGAHFFAADPAAAAKAGREQAIAKARKEADGYAAALGCHVVRMTRVTNASPPFGMRDLHSLIGYADYYSDRMAPSFYGSATYVTVGIDYVIAPN